MDRCAECGIVYDDLPRDRIAPALQVVTAQYRPRLGGDRAGARPAPHTWSPIEYAGHVGDVLVAQRERIALALRFDRPTFPSIGPDRGAVEERRDEHHPDRVIDRLERVAGQLASLLDQLSDAEWGRSGTYLGPGPVDRDVTWMARHAVHELAHHLLDISRSTDPATAAASG